MDTAEGKVLIPGYVDPANYEEVLDWRMTHSESEDEFVSPKTKAKPDDS